MTLKSHANLLGIFTWSYAGVLCLSAAAGIVSLMILLADFRRSAGVGFSYDQMMSDLNQPWGPYHYMFFAFVGYVLLAAAFLMSSIVSNIVLGKRLRSGILPSKRSIVITSVLSAISSIFAGLLFFPLGLALSIYGIWFATFGLDRFQHKSK